MSTFFDLRERLTSWFFRRDRDIHTGGNDINTGGGNVIVGAGSVDGVDLTVHVADVDAHHNQSHVLATGSALGTDHTISGAADGQVLRASSSTAARFDPLAHADLGSVTSDQHHNESHTVASHSDTTGTGSELDTLTDGSDASSLHDHDGRYFQESEFSSFPGSNSKPLESNAGGGLTMVDLHTSNGLRCSEGIAVGGTGAVPGDSIVMLLEKSSSPSTPSSGWGRLYCKTDGKLYFKNDAGTETALT